MGRGGEGERGRGGEGERGRGGEGEHYLQKSREWPSDSEVAEDKDSVILPQADEHGPVQWAGVLLRLLPPLHAQNVLVCHYMFEPTKQR